jgi:DNA-binding CsgD family transcriptional regulator
MEEVRVQRFSADRLAIKRPEVLLSGEDSILACGVRGALQGSFDTRPFPQDNATEAASRAVLWIHVCMSFGKLSLDRLTGLRDRCPNLPALVVGIPARGTALEELSKLGTAFLDASCSPAQLLATAESLSNQNRPQIADSKQSIFTQRQKEVLTKIAEGLANKEIASALGISVKTVDFHRTRVMQLSGLHSTAGLTRLAMVLGLVEPLA